MSFILPGRATLAIRELLAPIRSSQFWFSKTNIYFAPSHVSASSLSCITPKEGGTPIKPIG